MPNQNIDSHLGNPANIGRPPTSMGFVSCLPRRCGALGAKARAKQSSCTISTFANHDISRTARSSHGNCLPNAEAIEGSFSRRHFGLRWECPFLSTETWTDHSLKGVNLSVWHLVPANEVMSRE
jgi:hypothetical protein